MFEGIVGYQVFIILSMVGCRVVFPSALAFLAMFWSALSLFNIFLPPLLVFQLVVVWVTFAMLGAGAATSASPVPKKTSISTTRPRENGRRVIGVGSRQVIVELPRTSGSQVALLSPADTKMKAAVSSQSQGVRTAFIEGMPQRENSSPHIGLAPSTPEPASPKRSTPDRQVASTRSIFDLAATAIPAASEDTITTIVARRRITELVHFTHAGNLWSITTDGLLPVAELERKDADYFRNDNQRLDGHPNATSLSISFPNYRMFWKYRQDNPDVDWAVLILDPALLIDRDCIFCSLNAADHRIRSRPRIELTGPAAFEAMFALSDGKPRPVGLRDCDPTDPQAEVLIFGPIPSRFIRRIVFETARVRDCYADVTQGIAAEAEPAYYMPRDAALKKEQSLGEASRLPF